MVNPMLSTDRPARTLLRPQRVLVNTGQCSLHTCRPLQREFHSSYFRYHFLSTETTVYQLDCGVPNSTRTLGGLTLAPRRLSPPGEWKPTSFRELYLSETHEKRAALYP